MKLQTLFGALALILVIGVVAYMQLVVNKVPPQQVMNGIYPIGVIKTELTPTGIFSQMKNLTPVPSSEGAAIQYTPSDLGKPDISQAN